MITLDSIFGYYDKLIAPLSAGQQATVSVVLLLFLIWQVYMIFKSGHWLFIAALIVFLPGTWPAARQVGLFVWTLIKFLYTRGQAVF